MASSSKREYFPAIDILRGFAAYSVIVLHVIAHTNWTSFPMTGPLSWFRSGSLGVDLFFVISGFVVYYNAVDLLKGGTYLDFLASFFTRRLARIYPLYMVTLIFSVLVAQRYLLDIPTLWVHLLSHATFVHSFNIDWFSSINGVNWSIAIEVHFYILVALSITWLQGRLGIGLCLFAILVAWCWRWMSWQLIPDDGSELYVYRLFVLSTQLPGRLDQFAAGVLVAFFVRSPLFSAWRSSVWFRSACVIVTAMSTYIFVFPQLNFWPSGELAFVFGRSSYALVFGMMVLTACQLGSPMFLNMTAPFRYSGTISYGLYLWHLPLLLILKETGLSPLSVCVLTLTMTTAMAALSWHLLESPLIRASRTFERRVLQPTQMI